MQPKMLIPLLMLEHFVVVNKYMCVFFDYLHIMAAKLQWWIVK